jgi:hypothetical protein
MALGGGSILAASRKKPIDLRTLSVMNSMTGPHHDRIPPAQAGASR